MTSERLRKLRKFVAGFNDDPRWQAKAQKASLAELLTMLENDGFELEDKEK